MDLRVCLLLQLALLSVASGNGNFLFHVHTKFKGRDPSLPDFKAHDVRRHGRFLSVLDLPLGGNVAASHAGLYFTKIGLGSPAKGYYVEVDTSSDILWVNGADCKQCPAKSDLGIDLTRYDPKNSSSSTVITCDQDFCTPSLKSQVRGCKSGASCAYNIDYGDGSKTSGYFVKDTIVLDKVSGDYNTSPLYETVIFGCGTKRSGDLGASEEALDGKFGLGQANTSIISQLAAAGKAKKMFAHCLDSRKGGGIFAIGEVVEPEIDTIPLVPNRTHYTVVLKDIEVGGKVLQIPKDTREDGNSVETSIDSGTTLAYFPDDIYDLLLAEISSAHTLVKVTAYGDSIDCLSYPEAGQSINVAFPTIKFHFDKSLTLTVEPDEYLFPLRHGTVCIGWQRFGTRSEILLGGLVLSNKLVMYDMENHVIGWTDYDCASRSTKVRDEDGRVHAIDSHNVSSDVSKKTSSLLLIFIVTLFNFLY